MALELSNGGNSRFSINDIFFTRTDERGVIRSGNEVFQRVSVYSWDELLGAPHKVVRHPDMPKAVFHLLWERLKSGQSVGAYVCNMAQDKTPYWVYAMAMPAPGGYLSVRIKPTSDMLEKIVPLYNKLATAEKKKDVSAEDSAKHLTDAIMDMGFADYPEFMAHALDLEMKTRSTALGHRKSLTDGSLKDMHNGVLDIEKTADEIRRIFRSTHQIPYNMRLQAGRLEASGGPISVISNNHRQLTQELEASLEVFCESALVGHQSLLDAGLQTGAARLLNELHSAFKEEPDGDHIDTATEIKLLAELSAQLQMSADSAIDRVSADVRKFGQKSGELRRMMPGLELTRIMCKIERSKFDGDHAGLDEVVNRLAIAQKELAKAFDEIDHNVQKILSLASDIAPRQSNVA